MCVYVSVYCFFISCTLIIGVFFGAGVILSKGQNHEFLNFLNFPAFFLIERCRMER